MRKVVMYWPDLEVKVPFQLEDAKNPELCDEFWDNLPFEAVQEHGMVTGKIIYTWVPIVSTAPVHFAQLHTESPIGRVSYSQGTGNKVIIKYGECSEDCPAPVLGYVPEDYHERLNFIGRSIWRNYFGPKKIIKVVFEKE
jgi:hypothetical protein